MVEASVDLQAKQIGVRRGLFGELDALRDRYAGMEVWMVERLAQLRPEIESMPKFMRKVRMMMIPSVGYFTVVSKSDQAYVQYVKEGIARKGLQKC